jgi:hypothetical protein
MIKQELVTLLRSVGVDENTVTAMGNAYDIGYDAGAAEIIKIALEQGYVIKAEKSNESKAN